MCKYSRSIVTLDKKVRLCRNLSDSGPVFVYVFLIILGQRARNAQDRFRKRVVFRQKSITLAHGWCGELHTNR